MAVYINRERAHSHAVDERQKARDKAEKYAGMRGPFTDYCKQTKQKEEFLTAGLEEIDKLVDAWMQIYETGEVR